jgi:Family of unknown function (DUF6318)
MSEGLGVSIRRNVVSAMAAALVMSGVLSGCSDDSDDDPPSSGLPSESELTESTPTSPSPSPTEPTGPQPPPLPDAAKAPGKAGAKAFVAYYIRLLNYASWTGETGAVRQYSRGCRGCQADARLFESTYRKGGWFRGGRWRPVANSWILLPRHPGWFVGLNIDAAKGKQKRRRGAEVSRFLAERIHRDFHLVRAGQRWRVTYMEAEI